jgi:hypothetical protein
MLPTSCEPGNAISTEWRFDANREIGIPGKHDRQQPPSNYTSPSTIRTSRSAALPSARNAAWYALLS